MAKALGDITLTIKALEVAAGLIVTVEVQPGPGVDRDDVVGVPGTEVRGVWFLPVNASGAREAITGVIAFLVDHPKAALVAWQDGEPAPKVGEPWRVQRGPSGPVGRA